MRFGLLGTGFWARETHGPAINAHQDAELVGVWGRDAGRTATAAEALGTRPFAEVDELLAEVDAVAIALPPDVQAPLALRAAEAGKHLLLEKPVALDPRAADALVEAAERRNVASVVLFTARYVPEQRAWLAEGRRRGGWIGARAWWLGATPDDSPYKDSAWRRQHGGLWDVGPHALSMLVPLLGEVVSVRADRAPFELDQVLLRHAGGASSSMALSLTMPVAAAGTGIELFGSAGTASLPFGDFTPVAACTVAVGELIEQVDSGRRDHPCDVRFGREVTLVLAAAEESARTGRAVALKDVR